MKTNITSSNLDLTDSIKDYVQEKINGLDKFISNVDGVQAHIIVGKTTNHHQTGEIFKAEIQISLPGVDKWIYAELEHEDLYAAIDGAKDKAKSELTKLKDKQRSLKRRGARLIKKLLPF